MQGRDIMMTLFDEEEILEAYAYDIAKEAAEKAAKEAAEKAAKEATEKATEETEKKTAERMIRDGKLTLEEIAHYIPSLSLEDLKKIEHNIMQTSQN